MAAGGTSEYIPSIIVSVLFLLVVPWGRTTWIYADFVMTTLFSTCCILLPDKILHHQADCELDGIHLHMYRSFGILLLGTNIAFGLLKSFRDDKVAQTYLRTRIVGVSAYVIGRVYTYIHNPPNAPKWNKQSLYFGVYGDILWLLGNVIHAVRSDLPVKEDNSSATNTYTLPLRVDCLGVALFSVLWFCFPEWLVSLQTYTSIQELDVVHESVTRSFGAMLCGHATLSWCAVDFIHTGHKSKVLLSRISLCMLILCCQIYAQCQYTTWSVAHIWFGMMGTILWSLPSALGLYFAPSKMKSV